MATAVDELLDMLFDMIDEAKNAAFSGDKCVIERDKALDLLRRTEDALAAAHAEMRQVHNQFRSGMGGGSDRSSSSGGSRMYDAEADE